MARHGRRRWAILLRPGAMLERAELSRRALRHAVEAGAATPSDALTCERACHCVRISCDDRYQYLRGLVGPMCALLPISHSPEWDLKPHPNLPLRQIHLLPLRPHAPLTPLP